MNGGRVRDAHRPEPKWMSSTGELIDIERVTISLEGGRWKSTHRGNSLAAYPTASTVRRGANGSYGFAWPTLQLIVEEVPWRPERAAHKGAETVGVRVDFQEGSLQRLVKLAGGRWNPA